MTNGWGNLMGMSNDGGCGNDSGPQEDEPQFQGEPMQPHQQRVVTEQAELGEKLTKLNAFIGGATFNGLPEAERLRLARQAVIMKEYHDVLSERIAAF